jgi:hypothetical protein
MLHFSLRRCVTALAVILTASALAACLPDDEPTLALVDPSVFTTYSDPSGVFSLDLPPDWVVRNNSSPYAVNVEFSAPGSPEPLVGVYIVTTDISAPSEAGTPAPSLDTYIPTYQQALYGKDTGIPLETAREAQPDGSLRIKFLRDIGGRQAQCNDFVQFVGPYFVALRTRIPDEQGQMRTVSRIINTLSVNQSAGWSSIAQIAPEQSVREEPIGFGGINAWQNSTGGFEIVGQVVNNTLSPVEFLRVQAELYDAQDNTLGLQDVFVSADRLQTGQTAPFSIIFTEGLPPGTVRYDLHVSARYANPAGTTAYGPENFGVASQSGFDQNGALVINGQVRNEGTQAATLIKVIITILDTQGRVVGTSTALVDRQQLAPGETSSFLLTFTELGGAPSAYVINAEGVVQR